MAKRLDQRLAEEAARLYREGLSAPEVARRLGIGSTTVYRVLNKRGIPRRQELDPYTRRKLSEAQEQEVVRLYGNGESLKAIGRRFGCDAQTVRNIARRAGIKPRIRGAQLRYVGKEVVDEMVQLYKQGASQTAIAEKFGFSQALVSRRLRDRGINPHPRQVRGASHGRWKGGRVRQGNGYWALLVAPDHPMASMRKSTGYIMEHRLVMAEALGRPLTPSETVHHRDGNPENNALENLQLRSGRHGRGVCMKCADCGSTNIVTVEITED